MKVEFSNKEVTEQQKLSYKIYDMEADILKTSKRLEQLKEERKRLEEEEKEKKLGTVENVEKEFNKIFGECPNTNASARNIHNRRIQQFLPLKPLLTSILYTLKNMEDNKKVHIHETLDTIVGPSCPFKSEIEIGDEQLVAEVLVTQLFNPDVYDPNDKRTYCSDKPDDSFTFDKKKD